MPLTLESIPTDDQAITGPITKRWTREQYERLADEGFFEGKRVQLFRGVIVEMAPQGPKHSLALERSDVLVRAAFPNGYRIRVQMPFYTPDGSEPEPDLAVISGSASDPITSHPTQATLIVEVSDTSLRLDRAKAFLYALSRVPEYWIVNLVDGTVEIYREPAASPTAQLHYHSIRICPHDEMISPMAAPQATIKVNDLLP